MINNILVEDPSTVDGWLGLQRSDGLITLTADTLANSAHTIKRVTAGNVYIPGTYLVRATPDNVNETIGVWLSHEDDSALEHLVDHLIELFSRASYALMISHDNLTEIWSAQAADYTKVTSRELRHAGRVQLTFTVPVLPTRRKFR